MRLTAITMTLLLFGRIYDAGAVQARAVAGVELAGVFIEALPTLWRQTGTGAVFFDLRASAGYNFRL